MAIFSLHRLRTSQGAWDCSGIKQKADLATKGARMSLAEKDLNHFWIISCN